MSPPRTRKRSLPFGHLSELEGIIPALESAHAVAHALKLAREMKPEQLLIVNLSGRGDKDVKTVAESGRDWKVRLTG